MFCLKLLVATINYLTRYGSITHFYVKLRYSYGKVTKGYCFFFYIIFFNLISFLFLPYKFMRNILKLILKRFKGKYNKAAENGNEETQYNLSTYKLGEKNWKKNEFKTFWILFFIICERKGWIILTIYSNQYFFYKF